MNRGKDDGPFDCDNAAWFAHVALLDSGDDDIIR
jgi:hypothetical protein